VSRLDRFTKSSRRPWVLAGAALMAAVLIAACGSSTKARPSGHSAAKNRSDSTMANGHGQVDVLYAASLEQLMDTSIAPAFKRATGYTFEGFPAGSSELASEIRGRVRQADVFISAAPSVNYTLEGSANGNWVSWYSPFASTELVIGYNPHSAFAAKLRRGPWYRVITSPGFRLGFTDPKLDPKGVLTVAALKRAAAIYHDPALLKIVRDTDDLFPEEDLVGRLQSGQLDAGFFYTVEASAAKIPTVSLAPIVEQGIYTITVVNRAPHPAGAVAFVRFLLSSAGRRLMRAVGLTVARSPSAIGHGLPAGLVPVIKPGS
jgi:molybdate/tungstate transport system substrate-binding protein